MSPEGAFRNAMEVAFSAIAAQLAEETRAEGLVPEEFPIASLVAAVHANLMLWLEAIERTEFSALEQATVAWCTTVRTRGGDTPAAFSMLERTGELLLDAALSALDSGVVGADDGARGVLRAWTAAKAAYDRTIRATYDAASEQAQILKDVAENAPIGIGIATPRGDFTYMNPAHLQMLRISAEEAVKKNIADLLAPGEKQISPNIENSVPAKGGRHRIMQVLRSDGSRLRVHTTTFWVFTDEGEPMARCAFVRDMTDEERADEERRTLELQIIETQETSLRELATPLLPISERILVMPIVGTIDPSRASRIVEEMLSGIVRTGAGHVLVDITGVPRVTTEVGELILRAAKAAELVGAEMVLTGIRGIVAKTLLSLGISLEGVETQSTLRAGVAHALEHERAKMRAERRRS